MRRCSCMSHLSRFTVAVLVGGGFVVACSGSPASGFGSGTGGNTGEKTAGDASVTIVGNGVDGSTGTGSISLPVGSQDAQAGQASDASCGGTVTKAQQSPLDIYMMLDQSQSMSQSSKWTDITAAIDSFVQQPLSGVSLGLQFFGLPGSSGAAAAGTAAAAWAMTPALRATTPLPPSRSRRFRAWRRPSRRRSPPTPRARAHPRRQPSRGRSITASPGPRRIRGTWSLA